MYFDYVADLLRSIPATGSRRGMVATLTAGLFAASPFRSVANDTEAKNNSKSKKRQRNMRQKRRKSTQDSPALSLPPPQPGPSIKVDAQCNGSDNGGLAANGNDRIAQTFTAQASGALARAEITINKLEETFGDYILQIATVDNFGVPMNEVLAATSVANINVPDEKSIVAFAFVNRAMVVAGIQYALVLTRPGSNQLQWLGHSGDTCPGRSFVSPAQSETFLTASVDLDLNFTTFVNS